VTWVSGSVMVWIWFQVGAAQMLSDFKSSSRLQL